MVRSALLMTLLCLLAPAQTPGDALQKAVAAHRAGQLDAAIASYREVLKTDPTNLTALTNLGAALSKQGKYAEAIQAYKRGLKKDPANTNLSLNLALAHYKMGDLAAAESDCGPD